MLWEAAWFAPVNTWSLDVFRIAFGSIWIVLVLLSFPNWLRFYGPDGIVPLDQLSTPAFDGGRLSIFAHTRDEFWTWVVYPAALAIAVGYTIGWHSRLCAVLLFGLVISMVNRTPSITHGEDLVSRPLLFFGCFAPFGEHLSVDSWLRRRAGSPVGASHPVWPLRLMQVGVASIYFFSLPAKLADDDAWSAGSAIYYVMASANWGRFPALAPLFYGGLLSALLTYGTIVVEGAFPLLVWFRRTRAIALISIALLQVGIGLLVSDVIFFNLVMLASFLLFVPGEAMERAMRSARGWATSRRGRRSSLTLLPG